MKKILLGLLVVGFSLIAARADETVRAAQKRLATEGSYHGDATGTYDSETAAAVTRYQIRHGLTISGKLDDATTQALGITAAPKEAAGAEPAPVSGTWRRMRDGDMQFLKKLNAGAIAPPKPAVKVAAATPPPARSAPAPAEPGIDPHAPPPRLAEDVPATAVAREHAPERDDDERYGTERLRDYVGAFVLAGLDPAVGAELEFFADRVDYFGEKGVRRARIRRDLLRYDGQWPQRQFSLAGEISVERLAGGRFEVAFPLRYQLRNGTRHASGKVRKTLVLQKTSAGDLEITGVNERKL